MPETEKKSALTPKQREAVNSLRDDGFVVVIFSPQELGDADGDHLEEILIERGNAFLSSCS